MIRKPTIATLFLLACSAIVFAQDQRIQLTTDSPHVVDFSSTSYDFGTYKNNTWRIGYNSDAVGNKLVAGEPHFALQFEPKWLSGSGYVTEIYFKWCNATGTICKRPWGMNLLDADGSSHNAMHGRWSFFSDLGAQTASWSEAGFLDFFTSQGGIRTLNDANTVSAWNAALTGSLNLIKLDSTDRVVVSASGAPILFGGTASGSTFYYTGTVRKGTPTSSTQILGTQCAAIDNSTGEKTDDRRAINEILACLRQHGLLAN